MGWEWRYFVRLDDDESKTKKSQGFAANIEDVYFPINSDEHGLKLRGGRLEWKKRITVVPVGTNSSHYGSVELWEKRLLRDGIVSGDAMKLNRAVVEGATGEKIPEEGVSVICRKSRRMERASRCSIERTDCEFVIECYDGGGRKKNEYYVEHWHSVCIEALYDYDSDDSDDGAAEDDVIEEVRKVQLPSGAVVSGYPALVNGIAKRAAVKQQYLTKK